MSPHDLATRLEHTILRPQLLPPQVHKAATEAMQRRLAGVVVVPVWLNRVATMLRGSGVRVCATVGFPLGTNKSTIKAIEATSCLKDGADEIWVVPHLPNIIRCDLDAMKFELLEIARAARSTRPQASIHVVIETSMLDAADVTKARESIATACRAVRETGGDGIVAGSGFLASGLRQADAIKLMLESAEGLLVKVNGVDDLESARRFLDAGADRVASERALDMLAEMK